MGLPNRDEVEGKFDHAKGEVKETIGRAINDNELKEEGQADQAGGSIQEGFGKVKRNVGEAIEDLGEKINS
ncbi:MAG TPA: CsbD family protein [Pyrinomonadaceae bacterium]|nr:CsbD family protein [Pyrinomonadaceae bacterium]